MSGYIKKQEALQAKNEFLNPCVKKDTNEETEYARAYTKGWNDCNSSFIDNIESIKVADVQEVHHGKWIPSRDKDGIYKEVCLTCGYNEKYNIDPNNDKHPNYCPNCGAIMDGE